jgi:DNA polymerase III sliding clamp (beta) subunit (PCNA family)
MAVFRQKTAKKYLAVLDKFLGKIIRQDGYIKIVSTENALTFLCNNGSQVVCAKISAKTNDKSWSAVVSGLFLRKTIESIGTEFVYINMVGNKLVVKEKDGKREFKTSTYPVEDFTKTTIISGNPSFKLSGEVFSDALQNCISVKRSSSLVFPQIVLGQKNGKMYAFSTNGFCIAWSEFDEKAESDFELNIHPDVARKIVACMRSGEISFYIADNHFKISTGSFFVQCTNMVGANMHYWDYIPETWSSVLNCLAADFRNSITMAKPVFEDVKGPRIRIASDGEFLLFIAAANEHDASAKIDYSGDGINTTLDYESMLSWSRLRGGETICIKSNGKIDPVLFESANNHLLILPVEETCA